MRSGHPGGSQAVYGVGIAGTSLHVRMYEIHCGTRIVSRVEAPTPRYAVSDYLRSLGCRDDELEPMSIDTVAWRGAVYTAVAARDDEAAAS